MARLPWQIEEGDGPVVATAVHAGHEVRKEVGELLAIGDAERSDVQSYVLFMAGASFFIPPSFEYSYR